jgi:hypothetical protein
MRLFELFAIRFRMVTRSPFQTFAVRLLPALDRQRARSRPRLPDDDWATRAVARPVLDPQRYLVHVGAYSVGAHVDAPRAAECDHELDQRGVGEDVVGVRQRRRPARV